MNGLQTDIELLVGKQIERLHIVDSETTRQATKYIIYVCNDGTRVIAPHVPEFASPMPKGILALREAAKGEEGAFTVEEALTLYEGRPLGPPPETKGGNYAPEDITLDDTTGIAQTIGQIEECLDQLGKTTSREEIEQLRADATTLIDEMIPQDRRPMWYGKLGHAYKMGMNSIERQEEK
jgi:hypothetical protein